MRNERLSVDALRFLLAGGINTLLTSVVYFLGLLIMQPTASYAVAWLVGLVFVATFYPDKVFPGGRTTLSARLAVAAIIAVVFLMGVLLLATLNDSLGNKAVAFFATLAATTILNFVLMRIVLRKRIET